MAVSHENDLVIQTSGLTKRFGKNVAVDNLSMEVRRGRVYGLLGPNGSGKTTTMGMLLGLLRPTAGNFSLFGSTAGTRNRCDASAPSSRLRPSIPTCRGAGT